MNFDTAFDKLIGYEGGYSNNKDDPGGETRFGITEHVARINGYTGPMSDLPRDLAKQIYKTRYWDAIRGDELPNEVRYVIFDAAVNSGTDAAIRWMQKICAVNADGIIGPMTLGALNSIPPQQFIAQFCAARLKFMTDLAAWNSFGKGWTRRIANILQG